MFITKFLQVALPAYLICVHMVLCHNTAKGSLMEQPSRMEGSSREVTRYYKLWSKCSGNHVKIFGDTPSANGTASDRYTILEVKSRSGSNLDGFTIMGQFAGRYICFSNNGKLIVRYHWNRRCLFQENISESSSHSEFHLVDHVNWSLAFNGQGNAMPMGTNSTYKRHHRCRKFMKRDEKPEQDKSSNYGPVRSSEQLEDMIDAQLKPAPKQSVLQQGLQKRREPGRHIEGKNGKRRRRSRTTRLPRTSTTNSMVAGSTSDQALPTVDVSLVRISSGDQGLHRTLFQV